MILSSKKHSFSVFDKKKNILKSNFQWRLKHLAFLAKNNKFYCWKYSNICLFFIAHFQLNLANFTKSANVRICVCVWVQYDTEWFYFNQSWTKAKLFYVVTDPEFFALWSFLFTLVHVLFRFAFSNQSFYWLNNSTSVSSWKKNVVKFYYFKIKFYTENVLNTSEKHFPNQK